MGERVVFDTRFIKRFIKLALKDTGGCRSVLIRSKEQIVLASRQWVSLLDPLKDGYRRFHRIGYSVSRFSVPDCHKQTPGVLCYLNVGVAKGVEFGGGWANK